MAGTAQPLIVACTVGVDPDLVPQAADARRQAAGRVGFVPDGAGCRSAVVVPEGDDHPMIRRLAALLRRPAEVVTVPPAGATSGGEAPRSTE